MLLLTTSFLAYPLPRSHRHGGFEKKNVSIHKLFLSFPNKGGCSCGSGIKFCIPCMDHIPPKIGSSLRQIPGNPSDGGGTSGVTRGFFSCDPSIISPGRRCLKHLNLGGILTISPCPGCFFGNRQRRVEISSIPVYCFFNMENSFEHLFPFQHRARVWDQQRGGKKKFTSWWFRNPAIIS